MPRLPSRKRTGTSEPPNNPGLRSLIEAKREWHFTPDANAMAKGFRGWHERGYLPHFDAPNVTQIVTFNLVDSFPVTRQREWEHILSLPDESECRRLLEEWLDRGHGECWLRKVELASLVETKLRIGHGREYALQAWVVMPNHVHLVVDVWQKPLSLLIKTWKGATAAPANRILGRTGQFWQEDYWDTLIRDEAHLRKAVRYVEHNPARATLTRDNALWPWSSARRKDAYGRLIEGVD